MRVIFVLSNLAGGGAQRLVLTLSRELARRGHQVTLFLFRALGEYIGDVDPAVRVRSVLTPQQSTSRHAVRILKALSAEVAEHDVVVGSLEGWPTFMAYLAARKNGRPCIGWLHNDYRYSRVLQAKYFWVYPLMDAVAFVSRGAMESTKDALRIRQPSHWSVIHNAIDTMSARATAPQEQPPLVLAVGRLRAQKGFDFLIRAHAMLLREGLDHRLVILGEGSAREELHQLAAQLHVSGSVSMPGFIAEPADWYRRAQIFVLSSRHEGFGLVLLEAMASGVPVVAADCPSGPREILADGECGVLVAAGDAAALAAGIRRLLTDAPYRERIAALGIERAKEFSASSFVGKWERLLSTAAGSL